MTYEEMDAEALLNDNKRLERERDEARDLLRDLFEWTGAEVKGSGLHSRIRRLLGLDHA